MSSVYNYGIPRTDQKKQKIFSILIVDDDLDIADNLKTVLMLRGHNVSIVDDGIKCIAHCKDDTKHHDIIFLDYHMDGLDGAQVAEIVKDKQSKTIIFAYTGDNSTRAIEEFKNAGMDGAIIKPIDVETIEIIMIKLEQCNHLDKHSIKLINKKCSNSVLIFDEISL